MGAQYETYPIEVAGVKRDLRLFAIKPGMRIAILNILGDTELVQAVSTALAEQAARPSPRRAGHAGSQEHPAGAWACRRTGSALRRPAQSPTSPTWATRCNRKR